MRFKPWLIAVTLTWAACALAGAQVPNLLNYQGRLTDASGNALTGTYSVKFALYSGATGGTALWSETQSSISVNQGLFNVLLGSVTALPTTIFNAQLYLGITVGTDPEMTPRQQIAATAYALNSGQLGGQPASQYANHATAVTSALSTSVTVSTTGSFVTLPLSASVSLASTTNVEVSFTGDTFNNTAGYHVFTILADGNVIGTQIVSMTNGTQVVPFSTQALTSLGAGTHSITLQMEVASGSTGYLLGGTSPFGGGTVTSMIVQTLP